VPKCHQGAALGPPLLFALDPVGNASPLRLYCCGSEPRGTQVVFRIGSRMTSVKAEGFASDRIDAFTGLSKGAFERKLMTASWTLREY
jgi:hypothetical protein